MEVHEKSPLLKSLSRSLKYSDRELEPSLEITEPTMISYHDIEYAVPQRHIQFQGWQMPRFISVSKPILRKVSGVMKPGVNAIMGPSGAGKSTLLDILAKRRFPSTESSLVLLDGQPLPDNYNIISGYVVQDDILTGTLTVRENLHFSAALRLPSGMASVDLELRVNKLLHDLDLQHVANSRVGNQLDAEVGRGVSGGERKRTQIGMELVPFPKVLYLDEPTSGLDSFTAATVVKLLRRIGDEGKIIILSIHQPRYSIFRDFDTVTLLGRGETVYHGPASEAKEYFQQLGCVCEEHENPPDVFLDFIQERTKLSGNVDEISLARRYKDSKQAAIVESDLQKTGASAVKPKFRIHFNFSAYPSSFIRQLETLSLRCFRNMVRLSASLAAQIILSLFLALLIGTVYYQLNDDPKSAIQDRSGALFLSINCIIFTNIPAVEMFVMQRPLFLHETANGYYRVSAYLLARVMCDVIIIRLIPVFSFSLIAYWIIGLSGAVSKHLFYTLTLLLASLSTCSLALFFSALVASLTPATLLLASSILVMMIFGGLFVNLSTPPVVLRWLKYLSIIRYSMEGLAINEFHGRLYCSEKIVNGTCPPGARSASGNEYLEDQDFHHDEKWKTQIILFAMFIGILLMTYIRLRILTRAN